MIWGIWICAIIPCIFNCKSLKRYILNDLFVQSNNRSSGAGKKIIEKSLEYVKENNARYVCL